MSATTDSIYRWCEYGFRVTEENKSSAFWWIYFLPQPLLLETLTDDSKIMRKTQDEKMA